MFPAIQEPLPVVARLRPMACLGMTVSEMPSLGVGWGEKIAFAKSQQGDAIQHLCMKQVNHSLSPDQISLVIHELHLLRDSVPIV